MIIAFSRVLYGADYLSYVIRSALPYVDRFVILYTPVPTFGRQPGMQCPDDHDTLFRIAHDAAGDKLDWREGMPISAQAAIDLYPDAHIALELDADEVIHPMLFERILESAAAKRLSRYCYRLPFWHHWRSFRYACEDGSWPARLYLPQNDRSSETAFYDDAVGRVHHFGYARRTNDMVYKWETSAHIQDFRADWWDNIWNKYPSRLTDLHPVSHDFWNAQDIPAEWLPPVMCDHPYAGLEMIE